MKNRILLVFIALCCSFALSWSDVKAQDDFVFDVAAKCTGEAAFAVAECACTVFNRLDAGISPDVVLDAYFAEPVSPSPFALWATREVLTHGCTLPLWFMFSTSDTFVLGLNDTPPLLRVTKGNLSIHFYDRHALDA